MTVTQRRISISLSVQVETEADAVRIIETLSRTAAGLALEGLLVNLALSSFEIEE